VKKLNIGSADHLLDGWINCDINPRPGVMQFDAALPFPFDDNSFDRVFSEHMIEHVDYQGGARMLGECFRVLRPGGRIRISTPSLEFLIALIERPTALSRAYVEWVCPVILPGQPVVPETVVNNFVRAWGHQYIYSQRMLTGALLRAGFDHCWLYPIGESDDPEFVGLENIGRMPREFLQLETMTIEAEKL
jgi:predicted SAM-dependent methyltransferase